MTALERWMQALEDTQTSLVAAMLAQQLQLEGIEDCSRRNNLQLRGLPEATGTEELAAIFRDIADDAFPVNMSFDRIYRALGPQSVDLNHPGDMIRRVHQYSHKEIILRKVWEVRDTEFDGANIQILPDLSRATLQWQAMLEIAQHSGITYRWGFPIAVTFRKHQQSFILHSPTELPAVYLHGR